MYKLRYNLGRGKNYKKWKLINPDKTIQILDPLKVNILLMNVTLCNNKKAALDIYNGANKRVCSWIQAEEVLISNKIDETLELKHKLSYNPRVNPYWVCDNKDCDNNYFESVITKENQVFVV